jgi:hypothetical protein
MDCVLMESMWTYVDSIGWTELYRESPVGVPMKDWTGGGLHVD